MLKKIAVPLCALMLAFGMVATSVVPAEAGRGGRVIGGIAAGLITLGVLGAISRSHARDRHYYDDRYDAGYDRACYKGRLRCRTVGRRECYYDRYGEYRCSRPRQRCWRPTICE
jgi:hypothetical protein